MSEYQVVARKYRPQRFSQVIGQDPIVATLKNAMKHERVAQSYLFSGSRGTGKTTLARVLAKALNCQNLSEDFEPCNTCSSCLEITSGQSLDVLEIDGASHRGIDDIREINETIGYAASGGRYKIYIIDEVHMLTKEAFNALLKTLEEPPPKAKFFFATTEPHKVPATILSRCQRFPLHRIDGEAMLKKLSFVAEDLGVKADKEALQLIVKAADGGLRDAESTLDQVVAFSGETIRVADVTEVLGLLPKERFFALDTAIAEGDLMMAFRLAEEVFREGRDLGHFIEGLIEHFRTILLSSLSPESFAELTLSSDDRAYYKKASEQYPRDLLLSILDFLAEQHDGFRYAVSKKTALEFALLKLIRMRYRIPIETLVHRLTDLEGRLSGGSTEEQPAKSEPAPKPQRPEPELQQSKPEPAPKPKKASQVSVDPTPKDTEIVASPSPAKKPISQEERLSAIQKTSRYDTLLQFAAVEMGGRVQKRRR